MSLGNLGVAWGTDLSPSGHSISAIHYNDPRLSGPRSYAEARRRMLELSMWISSDESPHPHATGEQVLTLIKKSVKNIDAEPFTAEVRKNIIDKIGRLEKCGASAQAAILESELKLRNSLVEIKRLGYKVLTKSAIGSFQDKYKMTATRDGIKLHINSLENYIGNPDVGDAKDRIIPDEVLDKLEVANEHQVFDKIQVLWAEKVKDPILLGQVDGCEDFFYITEWGSDITFEQIQKGEK
jgi:hypothetical protein